MSPDAATIPPRCPKRGCDTEWIVGKASEITNDYEATTSAHLNLISAIELLRKRNGGFRVMFQFQDDRSA
jgi:mRNA-degrading endonuclease RelE of RelBE toxin-antitoxin system